MASDAVDPTPTRAVVWVAGASPRPARRRRGARLVGRAGLALCGAAALAGLVAGVDALAVADLVGTAPTTPLWVAPRPATTTSTAGPSVPAGHRGGSEEDSRADAGGSRSGSSRPDDEDADDHDGG